MSVSSGNQTSRPSARADKVDWERVAAELDEHGCARTGKLLTAVECRQLASLYQHDQALRESIYPRLAPIANRWRQTLGETGRFPGTLAEYLAQCARAGQSRPTPLILKYQHGDFNCLHQDLYGELVFPLQLTLLLSNPDKDFQGGEFMLVENRPRRQARGRVVPLQRGEAVIFPVHHRPVCGKHGFYRAGMRHGVSPIRDGRRFALGIIFHDAA